MKNYFVLGFMFVSVALSAQKSTDCDLTKSKEGKTSMVTTPILEEIYITKFDQDGKSKFVITLREKSMQIDKNAKGISLITANGNTITRPEVKFDIMENSGKGYIYQGFFTLTDDELKIIESSPIVQKVINKVPTKIVGGRQIAHYISCLRRH